MRQGRCSWCPIRRSNDNDEVLVMEAMRSPDRTSANTAAPDSGVRPPLTVGDVMSTTVVAVQPDAPLKRVASVLRSHRVSSVPVLDQLGRPLGLVTDADILDRDQWSGGLTSRGDRHGPGLTASDVMTSLGPTIRPEVTVQGGRTLLRDVCLRRLVVVDDNGKVVGVLTRNDLIALFLRSDAEIRSDVEAHLRRWTSTSLGRDLRVSVDDGVVRLEGALDNADDLDIVVDAVRSVDGVVAVLADGLTGG
jgi:CBS domain-containing protein